MKVGLKAACDSTQTSEASGKRQPGSGGRLGVGFECDPAHSAVQRFEHVDLRRFRQHPPNLFNILIGIPQEIFVDLGFDTFAVQI